MGKVLVTGGAGFVGSNCCNILKKDGYDVVAFDDLSLGVEANLDTGVTFVRGSVLDLKALDSAGPVDYVVHLASSSSAPMFQERLVESVENNIIGHMRVLEYARSHGVKKVLYASTSSIYGNNPIPLSEDQSVTPPNFYAATKHAQEELSHVHAATYGTEIIGFRFMSVYGPHEEHKGRFANLVSQFIWGMEMDKRPVVYGDGMQTRDFVSVRDVVAAFQAALATEKKFGSTVFNVGTARSVNMRELVKLTNEALGTQLEPEYIENPIHSGYIQSQLADLSKIKRELGYKEKVSLEEGIKELVEARKVNPRPPASLSF